MGLAERARHFRRRLIATVRGEQWWEYKIVPTLACFYATALMLDRPITDLWQAALMLLAALVPGAVYVSVTNDIADRGADAAAGKANRMIGKGGLAMVGMVAPPVALGVAFSVAWHDTFWLMAAYLAAWLVFTFYSVPPFRWKARGLLGVLADAAGAHLFPALVAVLLVYREAGAPIDPVWLCATAAWAFGYGLRGILWHQLADQENDRMAAVGTFVCRYSAAAAVRLACIVALPLEVGGVTVLLWQMPHVLPFVLLGGYVALVVGRMYAQGRPFPVIVEPKDGYSILLHEYYDVLLPLGILVASAMQSPADVTIFALHLMLFPQRATLVMNDIRNLFAWGVRRFA